MASSSPSSIFVEPSTEDLPHHGEGLAVNSYNTAPLWWPEPICGRTLLSWQWEARVPKTDIWKAILIWVRCKRGELERRKRDHDYKLPQFKLKLLMLERNLLVASDYSRSRLEIQARKRDILAVEREAQELEQETQALEMILPWVRRSGKEALKQAEHVLRADSIEGHVKLLLGKMEQEYWHTQPKTSCLQSLDWSMSVSSRKKIFRTMLGEIPNLVIKEHPRPGLRKSTLETPFSATLDKILRLSSWTPSSTHNEHLRELLRNALLMLNDLGGNEEYHDDLRDFMKQHTAFCAFTLDNANAITTGDSETTADLCKELRRLAQNLGKIASTKAEQYEKLYENFIAHKGDLSHWLDSASLGQGRSLVDNFTDSLKDMASSMRQEANFWKSQSNLFNKWPDIRQTYGYAIDALPNDHRSSTTHGSVTQNAEPGPQRVAQAAQRVSATSADLQKLRVNTTQEFLIKSENSISKRMGETRGYLESVVDAAEEQLSQPSEECVPKVIVRLAAKALCIANRWNKLQRKVKFWGGFLSMFSKPCQTLPKFDMVSGISQEDFFYRLIATPDTLIHPYLIEFEICLRNIGDHFLSRAQSWARISDPATFTVSLS